LKSVGNLCVNTLPPMYSKLCAGIFVALIAAGAVRADESSVGADLARARNCLACHQVDSMRVGPPFQGVADRYAGQAGAEAYLAGSIRSGGRERWGAVPMPAQPQVSDADAHKLARWILSLKTTH
jgi:cytochrome c